MNSEDASDIALAPFVRFFSYAIIRSMRMKNYPEIKPRIHTDMVPKVSERVMIASMGQKHHQVESPNVLPRLNPPVPNPEVPKKFHTPLPPRQDIKKIHEVQTQMGPNRPIQKFDSPPQQTRGVQIPIPPAPPRDLGMLRSQENKFEQELPDTQNLNQNLPTIQEVQEIEPPMPRIPQGEPMMGLSETIPQGVELTQFYGKITQLLNDSSISTIECAGMGQPIMVVRRGQKQPTKIVLSEEEINQILEKASDAAHIPILEGVFRAAVDNFSINAVISEMIGSRFVIKKIPSQMNAPLY